MAKGCNKFIKSIPGLEADVPQISYYFSKTIYTLIEEEHAFAFKDLVWIDESEEEKKTEDDDDDFDMREYDVYMKVFAYFLKYVHDQTKSWEKVYNRFCKNGMKEYCPKLKEGLASADYTWDNIKEEILEEQEEACKVILPLLKGEEVDQSLIEAKPEVIKEPTQEIKELIEKFKAGVKSKCVTVEEMGITEKVL